MSSLLRTVNQGSAELEQVLGRLERRGESDLERVLPSVRAIVSASAS